MRTDIQDPMVDRRARPHRPTVIVAEDDDDFRALLSESLETDGFRVTGVSNGVALIEALRVVHGGYDPPAVVISDDRMPGARGLDVLRQVRRWGWDLPLVLITGFGDPSTVVEAEQFGLRVMHKPFDLDDIRTLVGYLARKRGKAGQSTDDTCAACGSTDDLLWLDEAHEVSFCRECRELYYDFDPDDPLVDLGGDG